MHEVYRSVNKYLDSKGQTKLTYHKTYDTPGKAKAMATNARGGAGVKPGDKRYGDTFLETWCEKATEWERV